MGAAGEAPEKGALVRDLVPDGAGIPTESLEGGSDGGRQRIDSIWLPLEVEFLHGQEYGCSDHPPLRKGNEVLADRAATGVGASSNSENVSHVVDVDQDSSASYCIDLDIKIGNHVDNAPEAPEPLEGGSEEETQRINHILLTRLEVQPSEQQPGSSDGNSNHPHPPKGKTLLVSTAAGPEVGDKSKNISRVVEGQDRSDGIVDLDIEKGKLAYINLEATGGRDVETGPYPYPLQLDNEDASVCRICHMNSATAEIVDLGCACKLDLGQAHKRCADTWFAFRGNRECEICGEMAQNIKPPELLMAQGNLEEHPDTAIALNIHYGVFARSWVCTRILLICLLWVAVIFLLYKIIVPTLKKTTDTGTS